MIGQILLCVLAADFLSGLVHWFEDTYGLPSWPLVGRLVIEPNIDHHRNPSAFVRMGTVIGRNVSTFALAGAACGLAWCFGWCTWQLMLTAFVGSFGNEVHAWCHGGGNNPVVRLLQEMAIVQTPQHHARHHQRDYSERFCTLTNWVNPIVDRIGLWAGLEYVIWLAGVEPKRMTPERRFV